MGLTGCFVTWSWAGNDTTSLWLFKQKDNLSCHWQCWGSMPYGGPFGVALSLQCRHLPTSHDLKCWAFVGKADIFLTMCKVGIKLFFIDQ